MTKEKIDKLFELLNSVDFDIMELATLCDDEQLTKMFQNAINTQNEQLLINAQEQFKKIINLKIPSELLEYYYFKVIDFGLEEIFLYENQFKYAEELYEKKLQEIIQLSEDERIKKTESICKYSSKLKILKSLSNEKKLDILNSFDENLQFDLALSITDDTILLKAVDMVSPYYKSAIVEQIKDPRKKISALDKLEYGKFEIVKNIDNHEIQLEAFKSLNKSEILALAKESEHIQIKLKAIEVLEPKEKLAIVKSISDPKQRLKYIIQLPSSERLEAALSLEDPFLMLQAKDILLDKDKGDLVWAINKIVNQQTPEESLLRRLYDYNHDVFEKIDYRLLDPKYINSLGEEKISIIAIRRGVQKQILELDDKRYALFNKCIENYLLSTKTEDWRPIASVFLSRIRTGEYDQLIDNIEDIENVDFNKLNKIIQLNNIYNIQTIEDINNYEQIVREYCDKIMNSDADLKRKKDAVFRKIFGQDLEYAKSIVNKFGTDIDNLEDGDEKDFILSLKAIIDIEDEVVLNEIYNKCEEVILMDGLVIESKLKLMYGKMFQEGLYEPKEEDLVPEQDLDKAFKNKGLRVYDAGTNLKMIIHSIASYDYMGIIYNYESSWNRPIESVQHCCTSYIRNDMLGTAGIRHFCYGFTHMQPDALVASGYSDIYSPMGKEMEWFEELNNAQNGSSRFCTPETQINKTNHFNEMDYYFMQRGKKVQPDYIVAFRHDGEIKNIDKILKGAEDWSGKLPIVIVDVDRCLAAEQQNLNDMYAQYCSEKSPQIAKEILQKIRNNKQSLDIGNTFGNDIIKMINEDGIDNSRSEAPRLNEVSIGDLAENNKMVQSHERQEGMSAMHRILQEITNSQKKVRNFER